LKRRAKSSFDTEEIIKEKDISKKVITNTELLGFVLLVLIVLVLLFPTKRIEKLALKEEDTNPELSFLYLKKLTELYPNRYDYKLAFAKKAIRLGKDEYAQKICNELLKSKDPKAKKLALTITYDILKRKYFLSKNPKEKISVKKKMASILASLSSRTKSVNELSKYFSESVSMDMLALSFRIAMLLSNVDRKNRLIWLEKAYREASAMRDYATAVRVLDKMINIDTKNREKWVDKKIEILLFRKKYTQAVNTCIGEMLNTKSYEEKKKYFKKALEILSWCRNSYETAILVETYYRDFLRDDEMVLYMLKTLLAGGQLKVARMIALEVLSRLHVNMQQ